MCAFGPVSEADGDSVFEIRGDTVAYVAYSYTEVFFDELSGEGCTGLAERPSLGCSLP